MSWKEVIIGNRKQDVVLNIALVFAFILLVATFFKPTAFSKPLTPMESRYVQVELTPLSAPPLKEYQPAAILLDTSNNSSVTLNPSMEVGASMSAGTNTYTHSTNSNSSQTYQLNLSRLLSLPNLKLF